MYPVVCIAQLNGPLWVLAGPVHHVLSPLQAKQLCWSPNGLYLAVLSEHGGLELRASAGGDLVHSFDASYLTSFIQWHCEVAKDGNMLMARYVRVRKNFRTQVMI